MPAADPGSLWVGDFPKKTVGADRSPQSAGILVDMQVVAWMAFEPIHLSSRARRAIDHARETGDGLAISDITLLELTTLAAKGRIRLDISLEAFLREVEARFTVLPITSRGCVLALGLPPAFPKDPADRIIAATALAEGLPLLTADRAIRRSKVLRTIW